MRTRPDDGSLDPPRDLRRNVEINVGKACNNRCVFCLDGLPSPDNRRYMPLDEMVAELTRWRRLGHRSVGFLGGEPTIYPHIVESIATARDLGYTRIAIASNVTRLVRPRFTDRLLTAGLTRVTVSMHGHTAALEDRLTRVPGVFDKKCTAIRYLLLRQRRDGLLRDGVSVNIVLNGWNYRALPKMLRFFFEELGLVDVRTNFVRPEGYAEGSHELTPRYRDVVPLLMRAVILNERHFHRTFTFGGVPVCVLPEAFRRNPSLMRRYVGEYRDLDTDCSIRAEGHDDGISRVEGGRARFNWQDRKRLDLKGGLSACRSCSASDRCEGVWRNYVELYGDEEISAL